MQDPNLTILDHPVVHDRLSRMRDETSDSESFRRAMRECGRFLCMEATRSLTTSEAMLKTPITDMKAKRLSDPSPLIVPILRAGLGMAEAFQDVIPEADTGHVGLYRDEETKRPVQYLVKLPPMLDRPVFVVDPMLATGHSLIACVDVLISAGVAKDNISAVVLLAAPEGVKAFRGAYPDMKLITAAMDSHLNDHAYIVPGLGDAGDRYFGTV